MHHESRGCRTSDHSGAPHTRMTGSHRSMRGKHTHTHTHTHTHMSYSTQESHMLRTTHRCIHTNKERELEIERDTGSEREREREREREVGILLSNHLYSIMY